VNLIVGAPWWLVGLLAAALVAAAVEDAVRLRISNITCAAVLILAIVAMTLHGFPLDLWRNLAVFLVVLTAGTFAFSARLLGGGDVKLFSAVALWMSFPAAVWLCSAVFLSGGALAVLFILFRSSRWRAAAPRANHASNRIPYGLAIVAGALLVFGAQLNAFGAKPERPNPLELAPLG
jgi:prepilin peptidase CpaA